MYDIKMDLNCTKCENMVQVTEQWLSVVGTVMILRIL